MSSKKASKKLTKMEDADDYAFTKKFYNNSQFSDCKVFSSDGVKFELHRMVLADKSEYFQSMFANNMKEGISKVINLPEKAYICSGLFQFMYCGELDNSFYDFLNLYIAADKYLLEELKNVCIRHIMNLLHIDNAIDILIFADSHNKFLKIVSLRFIASHLEEIKQSFSWKKLSFEEYSGLKDSIIDRYIAYMKNRDHYY